MLKVKIKEGLGTLSSIFELQERNEIKLCWALWNRTLPANMAICSCCIWMLLLTGSQSTTQPCNCSSMWNCTLFPLGNSSQDMASMSKLVKECISWIRTCAASLITWKLWNKILVQISGVSIQPLTTIVTTWFSLNMAMLPKLLTPSTSTFKPLLKSRVWMQQVCSRKRSKHCHNSSFGCIDQTHLCKGWNCEVDFCFFPWTSTAWDTENELLPNRFFRDSCAHFLISTWPLTDFKMEFAQIPFKWSRNSSARTGLCLVNYEVMGCQNVGTARTQFQVMHANYVKKNLSSGFSWFPGLISGIFRKTCVSKAGG